MGSRVTIIGYIYDNIFKGQIRYDDGEYKALLIDGEYVTDWSDGILDRIFENEQIDVDVTICRIMLMADMEIDHIKYPVTDVEEIFAWEEIRAAATPMGNDLCTWHMICDDVMNDVSVYLPHATNNEGVDKQGFIYSNVKVDLPYDLCPWEPSEQILNTSSSEPPVEVVAKPKATEPVAPDASELYHRMREVANTPQDRFQ